MPFSLYFRCFHHLRYLQPPCAGDDPETVKESQLAVIKDDEALQSLDAVKNGRVYPIMLSEMYASATRTQDGIETFAKGLYPDVNLD